MLDKFVSHAVLVIGFSIIRHEVWIYVKEYAEQYGSYGSGDEEGMTKYEWATHVGMIPNERERKMIQEQEGGEILLDVYGERVMSAWESYVQC